MKKTRTAQIKLLLANLDAIDCGPATYDTEGVGHTGHGVRARAELHNLGIDMAHELGELCQDAGDRDGAAAAEARHDAHSAAYTRYQAAARQGDAHSADPQRAPVVHLITSGGSDERNIHRISPRTPYAIVSRPVVTRGSSSFPQQGALHCL
ncbi:hypothetical protein AB0C21_14475 [Spirillospora sp. NPDC049024]